MMLYGLSCVVCEWMFVLFFCDVLCLCAFVRVFKVFVCFVYDLVRDAARIEIVCVCLCALCVSCVVLCMSVVFVRYCVMLYGVFWVVCSVVFVCVAICVCFDYDVSCDMCKVCVVRVCVRACGD